MRCLTSRGHGAAPCRTYCSDETSAVARTASGSCRSRWKWVGTTLVPVTRRLSTRARKPSGVQPSISTMAPPACSAPMAGVMLAEWYSGAETSQRANAGRSIPNSANSHR